MSGHDQRTLQISKLEVDLANQQAKYETWLVENNDKIGQQAYEDYVEQFRIWQTDMMAKLNELRTSIKRQPVVNTPTLGKSLDEQVADAVKDVSLNDFMKVLMTLVKKDPSLLERLNQVIWIFKCHFLVLEHQKRDSRNRTDDSNRLFHSSPSDYSPDSNVSSSHKSPDSSSYPL